MENQTGNQNPAEQYRNDANTAAAQDVEFSAALADEDDVEAQARAAAANQRAQDGESC